MTMKWVNYRQNLLVVDKNHWLSAQNVVYTLGQEVPKLVYALLMCKPVVW